jgi:hypothetical protein
MGKENKDDPKWEKGVQRVRKQRNLTSDNTKNWQCDD